MHFPRACLLLIFLYSLPVSSKAQPDANCAASAENIAWWREIYDNRQEERSVADALAYDLLACLASPNSELRDTFGYGLYTYWLRNEQLSLSTRQFLFSELMNRLASDNSLERSFSALILSELMRADAQNAFLASIERQQLLDSIAAALETETDYRGLDTELGWVHPVAHMADVLWRFALHPALTAAESRQILTAIQSKAISTDTAYAFNEGDRLARVVAILIRREVLTDAQWLEWLGEFEFRSDGSDWSTAFSSPAGMRELHNAKLFVRALADQLQSIEPGPAISEELALLTALFAGLV